MNFKDWIITESSLTDLFKSAVKAFPHTARRQHAVSPIEIKNINFTPFVGVKTLLIRSRAKSGDKEYNPIVLLKQIQYHPKDAPNLLRIASLGENYFLEQPSSEDNDVLVRCNCQDFYWRGVHFNKLDHSLYGRDRAEYHALHNPGSANPQELPMMCKHLMALTNALKEIKLLSG